MPQSYTITLSCDDQPGIVAAVATELSALGANITESNQFWDRLSNRFFMRIAVEFRQPTTKEQVEHAVKPVLDRFGMKADVVDAGRKLKIIIMVSRFDHAMLHLLYQIRVGWLQVEVVAIVSNHEDSRRTAEIEGIPYHVFNITKDNKAEKEKVLLDLVRETEADLVVLARYMQVLSDNLSTRLFGKVINIHHSFLPSFKGAKPYHQAFERGVKLIGATAHYVTPDLDEGPIIEQETERVTHTMTADDFVATGRDIESRVLARAVKMHLERRVMLNGHKTIVFA
ncbi:formyltetrahydrofolate deformylase [Mesorhizobium sp. BR1-1-3]|uniref:formyltetrahydrofolate deformylase n=1 Tax=unclassified Mesorhizobium TaxID=325217 RepID=UPI000FEA0AEA|nr:MULTISPECIES: formyltetrahydrofolate deformylase [unclassified Mesorhizobium]MBZ9887622.1 formyltetrahydrofolate deformylase [Mesorhizobium sp. BR1-1-3]RWE30196.1 MAG: formyltetrahydrofolate deformylase [Mesorhizobium sp.]TGP88003.1 formyltetrahydrofolate deformylase [Mesorhizobium sp. M8A.F.Ca.ET.218.01.1.1]TGT15801.1 formyltetrahydrofolate deformylase [Mesorhizobium sp. M8A.F.Ca.ET.213.01.1.1]